MVSGDFTIQFRLPELPSYRNALGQFQAAGAREQIARNQRLATVLQQQVVARVRNRVAFGGRASASTGRLVRVTADRRNVRFDQYGIGVGVPDFLDGSIAKYWRTFEEGSAEVWSHPFVGTRLHQVGPYKGPSAHGQDLRAAGENFRYPDDDRFVVKREIAPAHAYRDVFQEANLVESAYEAALKYLQRIFGDNVVAR